MMRPQSGEVGNMILERTFVLGAILWAWSWTGCSQDLPGPKRFAVTGEVVYQGKPLPRGTIFFVPDSSKGNQGPGSIVQIRDGKFMTAKGGGVVGGAHTITISGYDGVQVPGTLSPDGTLLFHDYKLTRDLPLEDAVINFDVPGKSDKKM